jgi:anti-sigma factor RsiW
MSSDESQEPSCAAPPALSGIAVMAAADGEADEHVLAHLRSCPSCTARVRQLRALQRQLLAQLYRATCPRSELLVDYCQGLLDPFERAAVTHHLALCPHCAAELALLERAAPVSDSLAVSAIGRATLQIP